MITVTCKACLAEIDSILGYENHVRMHERGNLHEIAKNAGLKTYDIAMPQPWVDDVREKTGRNAFGNIVWCYDKATIWGAPVALTEEGQEILRDYATLNVG